MTIVSRRAALLGVGVTVVLAHRSMPAWATEIGTEEGDVFPDVVYRAEDGTKGSVGGARGRVAMVYLWAQWCPICDADIVNIQWLCDTFAGEPAFVPIVMNIMDEYRAGVAWARASGLTLPLYDSGIETRGSAVATTTAGPFCLPRYTPQFYLLDRRGTVARAASARPAGTPADGAAIKELLRG